MRFAHLLPSLTSLLAASPALADTLYVSPTATETGDCASRATPCSLATAASAAVAGDTVVLMDGVYLEPLYVVNSGTPDAWITFEADECATPIIEGEGSGPNDDTQTTGVGSAEAEYVRFRGLVSRGWNIGFGNGWAGGTDSEEVSNGHWEIEYCASYSNGRTGFTFFSAPDFHLKNSISAHNGSSVLHSWSSGVTLFEATGTNIVEGTVSFENTDAERHTDGSGFIVDEESNGASFLNNIAFGNGGSCLRLTKSSGTRFINNTCYHNSQFGSLATGPSNPSELYFTNGGVTVQGVTFMNNVIVGTGLAPAGQQAVVNQPTTGWTNNVVTTGSVSFFTDPTGSNPNFTPTGGELIGAGNGSGAPASDIGFDPRCIVKRTPVMVGAVARESWWQYDVDIEYIQSIGGVAACFNAATRSGATDIGAYRAGSVTTVTPGSCVPPVVEVPTGGTGGEGGAPTGGTGGDGGTPTGGAEAVGGTPAGGTGGSSATSTGADTGPGTATATFTSSDTGTGADTATFTGTGTGTSADTATYTGTGTGTGTASLTGVDTGTGAGTASATVSTTGTGANTTTFTGTGTGAGTGVFTGTGTGQGTNTDTTLAAGGGEPTAGESGCGCRVPLAPDDRGAFAALGGLGLALLARRRRAKSRARAG